MNNIYAQKNKTNKEYNIKYGDIIEKCDVLARVSPDCVKFFDIEENLLYANPVGLKKHNCASVSEMSEKYSKTIFNIVDDDVEKFKEAMEKAKKGGVSILKVRHMFGGNNYEQHLETITPVIDSSSNEVLGILSISRDITEMKKAEKKLRDAKKDLELKITERTKELDKKIEELEKMNKLMVGREIEMIRLKGEIKKCRDKK